MKRLLCIIVFFVLAWPSVCSAQEKKVTVTQITSTACFNESDLDRVNSYIKVGDYNAWADMIRRGRCVYLHKGDEFYIIKGGKSGRLLIRPVNRVDELWTDKYSFE